MLINAKIGKHAYQLDHTHLPLQPQLKDNEVVMDLNHPSSATARQQADVAKVQIARDAPAPQLRSREGQMPFLVRTIHGMEKNISEIFWNEKSLERIMETKFHDLDVKVTELATIIEKLQHEVDAVHIPCIFNALIFIHIIYVHHQDVCDVEK